MQKAYTYSAFVFFIAIFWLAYSLDDSAQKVERTKKRTRGLITIGRMDEIKERVQVNQIQSSSQRNKEKLKHHEAMEGFAQVDGYANQEHQVMITNKEGEQGN